MLCLLSLLACRSHAGDGIRSPFEIAQRVLGLMAVSMEANKPGRGRAWVKRHGLDAVLSPTERLFLSSPKQSEAARIKFSWWIEATAPLLWAMNQIAELPSNTEEVQFRHGRLLDKIVKTPSTLTSTLTLRPLRQIMDGGAAALQAHWRVRNAELRREAVPFDLNVDIVMERHKAFNWLLREANADWDHVPMDT